MAKGAPQASARGVLVLGLDGIPQGASGIAEDAAVAGRIATGWQEARARQRQLFAVEAPDGSPLVVVALPTPEATFLVAMRTHGRDALFEFVGAVDMAGDILTHFLSEAFGALFVVDREGLVRYMSPVHERFFGLPPGGGVGSHVTGLIENSRLHHVASSGKSEVGLLLETRGVTRIVTRHPIRNADGEVVGALGQMMFKGPEQLQALSNEVSKLRSEVAYYRRERDELRLRSYGLEHIVGDSPAMQRLKQQLVKVAPLDVPVLLTGESGTGKELAANAIHKLSARGQNALVVVNAAALPSTLVESELFGYEGGAFTGAERKGRIGKAEQADRGSLFLDEVGDMPADVQVKLLRVLQDGSFQRVGGHETRRSNFRLISASNRDFDAMVADGNFRLDLFYRIGGVTIRLPALRERLEDVPLLAELALREFAQRHGHAPKRLSPEGQALLMAQPWPGNVRQLMHVVERAAIFSESDVIGPEDFDLAPGAALATFSDAGEPAAIAQPQVPEESPRMKGVLAQVEEQMILEAMRRFHGNKKRVAAELGISRTHLYRRLAQIGAASKPEA